MWGQIIYNDRSWETFFQDVGDDGTDISEDIDWWKFLVYIQSVVPFLE